MKALGKMSLLITTLVTTQALGALPPALSLKNNKDLQCTFLAGMGIALHTFEELGIERNDLFEERMQGYVNVHLRRYQEKLLSMTPEEKLPRAKEDMQSEIDAAIKAERGRLAAHLKARKDPQDAAQTYLVSRLKSQKCETK